MKISEASAFSSHKRYVRSQIDTGSKKHLLVLVNCPIILWKLTPCPMLLPKCMPRSSVSQNRRRRQEQSTPKSFWNKELRCNSVFRICSQGKSNWGDAWFRLTLHALILEVYVNWYGPWHRTSHNVFSHLEIGIAFPGHLAHGNCGDNQKWKHERSEKSTKVNRENHFRTDATTTSPTQLRSTPLLPMKAL